MNLWESFSVAFDGLKANKMRSFLTMLGVIIGVAAVILLVSMGQGVKSYVTEDIERLGPNTVYTMAGKMEHGGGPPTLGAKPLKLEDARAIENHAAGVAGVAPMIESSARAEYRVESKRAVTQGVTANFAEISSFELSQGKFFNSAQVEGARSVCVLGAETAEQLFGDKKAIGEHISLAGRRFKVVGVMEKQGGLAGMDADNAVYLPITAAQKLFGTDILASIVIEARDADSVDLVVREVKKVLGRRLSEDDFTVMTMGELLTMFQQILNTLTTVLSGIAAISLLVGGIGIMNIMLVSVTERTREIGIRKAVGARTSDILVQFVIESVTLSLSGGALGIGLGAGLALAIGRFVPNLPAEVTAWSVALAFVFSAGVGIFFGVYPAWKASRLNPIDALRYE